MKKLLSSHRWLVLVAATLGECVVFFPNGWSVFQPYLSQQLNCSADAISLALPLCMVFFGLFSLVGGRFQDVASPRTAGLVGTGFIVLAFFNVRWLPVGKPIWLYIGFSLCFGIGCGFLYQTILAIKMRWFADKKGFAAGLTSCLAGLFMIPQTYLTEALLSRVDVRQAMSLCGLIALAVCLPVSLLLASPDQEYIAQKLSLAAEKTPAARQSAPGRDFTTAEMLHTPQFYLFGASLALIMPAYMLITPQLVSLCMGKGLSKSLALSTLAVSSAAAAVGRLVIPILSDKLGRKSTMAAMWGLTALSALLFFLGRGSAILVIWAVLTFCYNGGSTLISSFNTDLFGLTHVGTNAAVMNLFSAAGSLLGPAVLAALTPLFPGSAIHLVGIVGAALATASVLLIDTNVKAPARPAEQ